MSHTESLLNASAISMLPCSLLVLKPASLFKDWVSEICIQEHKISGHTHTFTQEEVSQDCVVFCIPQFQSAYGYQQYLEKQYKQLSALTFTSWYVAPESWPTIESYDNFLEFFTPEFHSHLYDLPDPANYSQTQNLPAQNASTQDSDEIMRLNGMVLLLRPMRTFWAWIKNSEHKLPDALQAIFKKNHAGVLLDMNCSVYCIPSYTDAADLEKFIQQVAPAIFKQELIKWDVPLEHANRFHLSDLLSTYFIVEIYRTALIL
jgi:hypothetical protein